MNKHGSEHPANDSNALSDLVANVLSQGVRARDSAIAEFRSIFDPLVERIASRYLSALPGYTLLDLVDEATAFLTTGLRQDAKGKPSVRRPPLQRWLEKPEKENLHKFIAVCTANYFRDLRRQRNSKNIADLLSLEEPELRHVASTNARLGDVTDIRFILRAVLPKLPPHDMFILHRVYVDGLTHQEISHLLGITESQVDATLHHARKSLKQLVRSEFPNYHTGPDALEVAALDFRSEVEHYSPPLGKARAAYTKHPASRRNKTPSDRRASDRAVSHSVDSEFVPFVSPVVDSMNVKARLKIGGEVAQPAIDLDNIIYFDE